MQKLLALVRKLPDGCEGLTDSQQSGWLWASKVTGVVLSGSLAEKREEKVK